MTTAKVLFVFVIATSSIAFFALSQDSVWLMIGLAALVGLGLGLITDKRP